VSWDGGVRDCSGGCLGVEIERMRMIVRMIMVVVMARANRFTIRITGGTAGLGLSRGSLTLSSLHAAAIINTMEGGYA
jgi:hypothetical protein